MPSTSAILNKLLNQMVMPILRDAGFECIDARNALSWRKECILVFEIRAVGSYIADVTGWPPGSVNVWMGAYYTFAPRRPGDIKRDARKRLRPTGPECHLHVPLNRIAVKPRRPGALNAPERRRRDIWWVERDGSNANDVAADIAAALCKQGLRWFADASDLKSAYRLVEKEHDCFVKFALAAMLAQHIGTKAGWRKYHGLAAKAAERIGESPNPSRWYDIHVGPF
jgi:hypothetical protein